MQLCSWPFVSRQSYFQVRTQFVIHHYSFLKLGFNRLRYKPQPNDGFAKTLFLFKLASNYFGTGPQRAVATVSWIQILKDNWYAGVAVEADISRPSTTTNDIHVVPRLSFGTLYTHQPWQTTVKANVKIPRDYHTVRKATLPIGDD